MPKVDRSEVVEFFNGWRKLVDRHDLAAMKPKFSADARGGNSIYGISEGRDAIMEFMARWPESVPNRSLWVAIDGERVVDKWRETLPGSTSGGDEYSYDGISEFHYAGTRHWDYMYGMPDVVGLQRVYARWKADGLVAKYGEIYPGL